MSQKLTSFSGIFNHEGTHKRQSLSRATANTRNKSVDILSPLSTYPSQYEEDNVLMDPDWAMDGSHSPRLSHQNRGSFAAMAGMSPCLGVPPVDCLFYPGQTSPPIVMKKRRRHFSLEDYHEVLDDSSSSTDSFSIYNNSSKAANAEADCQKLSDLNPAKSFMNDLSYTSDLGQLEMGSESISQALRSEFESLMVNEIQNGNPELSVNFPPDLLSVIARHVLQEAVEEPYGIKGCLLHIQYEGQTALHHLGTLNCDPEVAAKTFELTLTLRQAQATWGQRMARRLSFSNSTSTLSVSTSYKLVKKRVYRS